MTGGIPFDATGSQQIVQAPGGALTTYAWDYENQNTAVALADGTRATYLYYADNRRVEKDA